MKYPTYISIIEIPVSWDKYTASPAFYYPKARFFFGEVRMAMLGMSLNVIQNVHLN